MNENIYSIDAIIPTYNQSMFILDAIKSIENQTYKPLNIFIIDDGSNDDTFDIVNKYIPTSQIPIIYHKKENGGPNSARNFGLKLSKADFVAFLDSDDTWDKDKLSEQINLFEKSEFKNLGLVYANYSMMNKDGFIDKNEYTVDIDKSIRGNAYKKLLAGNKILGSASSVLIKKEVFDSVGIFDENLKFGEDWDMWLRISEKYEIDFVDKVLVHIRRHNTNQTNNRTKAFLGEIDFYNKWSKRIDGLYPAPSKWADTIIFNLIFNIIKNRNIKIFTKKIDRSTKKFIFKKSFGSIFLYIIYFVFNKLFDFKNQIKKLKRYARQHTN